MVRVQGKPQHEAAGVGDLGYLTFLDVYPVELARLASRVGVAVEPPGYALSVVQPLHEHRYLRVIVQKAHGSSQWLRRIDFSDTKG